MRIDGGISTHTTRGLNSEFLNTRGIYEMRNLARGEMKLFSKLTCVAVIDAAERS